MTAERVISCTNRYISPPCSSSHRGQGGCSGYFIIRVADRACRRRAGRHLSAEDLHHLAKPTSQRIPAAVSQHGRPLIPGPALHACTPPVRYPLRLYHTTLPSGCYSASHDCAEPKLERPPDEPRYCFLSVYLIVWTCSWLFRGYLFLLTWLNSSPHVFTSDCVEARCVCAQWSGCIATRTDYQRPCSCSERGDKALFYIRTSSSVV